MKRQDEHTGRAVMPQKADEFLIFPTVTEKCMKTLWRLCRKRQIWSDHNISWSYKHSLYREVILHYRLLATQLHDWIGLRPPEVPQGLQTVAPLCAVTSHTVRRTEYCDKVRHNSHMNHWIFLFPLFWLILLLPQWTVFHVKHLVLRKIFGWHDPWRTHTHTRPYFCKLSINCPSCYKTPCAWKAHFKHHANSSWWM